MSRVSRTTATRIGIGAAALLVAATPALAREAEPGDDRAPPTCATTAPTTARTTAEPVGRPPERPAGRGDPAPWRRRGLAGAHRVAGGVLVADPGVVVVDRPLTLGAQHVAVVERGRVLQGLDRGWTRVESSPSTSKATVPGRAHRHADLERLFDRRHQALLESVRGCPPDIPACPARHAPAGLVPDMATRSAWPRAPARQAPRPIRREAIRSRERAPPPRGRPGSPGRRAAGCRAPPARRIPRRPRARRSPPACRWRR